MYLKFLKSHLCVRLLASLSRASLQLLLFVGISLKCRQLSNLKGIPANGAATYILPPFPLVNAFLAEKLIAILLNWLKEHL